MRWLVRILIGLAVSVAVWWLWTIYYFPYWPFRYKVTVEVQTPGGLKSGSSVMQTDYGLSATGFVLGGALFNYTFDGEAVFVDLGDGKNVVLTLQAEGSRALVQPMRRCCRLLSTISLGIAAHAKRFLPRCPGR